MDLHIHRPNLDPLKRGGVDARHHVLSPCPISILIECKAVAITCKGFVVHIWGLKMETQLFTIAPA